MPIREITNGTWTIPMTSIPGISFARDGGPSFTFDQSQLAGDITGSASTVVEAVRLMLGSISQDAQATQVQTLMRAFADAYEYRRNGRRMSPIWVKEQFDYETNPRYALIFGCYEFEHPDMFGPHFQPEGWMIERPITILREAAWRGNVPNAYPSAKTLTAVEGPASPTYAVVSNKLERTPSITSIQRFDASVPSYTNLTGSSSFTYFPAAPAVGDILYVGSTSRLPLAIVFNVAATVATTWTLAVKYSKGAGAWGTLSAGSDYCFSFDWTGNLLVRAGREVLLINAPTDSAIDAVNAVTDTYWIRIEITGYTSGGTSSQSSFTPYMVNSDYLDLPSTAIGGDVRPLVHLRLFGNWAQNYTSPVFAMTSRVLIASKSRGLTKFQSKISVANALAPSGWTLTAGTDTAANADQQATGLTAYRTSFATNTNFVKRWTLARNDGDLLSWFGAYHVFMRVRQNSGAAGDVTVGMSISLGDASNPSCNQRYQTLTKVTKTINLAWEVLHLGRIRIPFSEESPADAVSTSMSLIMEGYASRSTGAATLDWDDVMLMPCDEWYVGLRDPLLNTSFGSSALREQSYLDLDGGVLIDRCVRAFMKGSDVLTGEEWLVEGRPPNLRWAEQTRLYFLFLMYPTTFGVGPLIAPLGISHVVELRAVNRYLMLRGAG